MDNQDIQAVLDYIVGLWNPKKDKFGEIHQKLLVGRIKGFRVTRDEAEAAIGEVYLTTKSFGGVCIEDIYKRLKGINESKFRAEMVYKKPAYSNPDGPTMSFKEWVAYYSDPDHPERLASKDEQFQSDFMKWKQAGKVPPIVKSVGKGNG